MGMAVATLAVVVRPPILAGGLYIAQGEEQSRSQPCAAPVPREHSRLRRTEERQPIPGARKDLHPRPLPQGRKVKTKLEKKQGKRGMLTHSENYPPDRWPHEGMEDGTRGAILANASSSL
ncbi:hypothetical protein KSP39_PZI005724 [Platanthera zijinensis]|uniref:Uncharacterized protein n=1 Tax=Platanthera zijinensis TaxID=2320716 RepID=A0AAP0GB29_9ASPA